MNSTHRARQTRKVGDLILPFVTRPIPSFMSDLRPPEVEQPPASTLICADGAGCSELIARGLSLFGRSSTVVYSPLDAIVRLQDVTTTIDAVVVSLQDPEFDISAFFGFLKDEHPHIRRIAFAEHEPRGKISATVRSCQHDMILWDPWDRADFVEILKDAIDCRLSRTRSSWTDLQLFESSHGADRLAIAEIVRRYRYRIVRLALDATHHSMDTEDAVQDVYLAIVRCLPLYRAPWSWSPGHWIDQISRKAIRPFSCSDLDSPPARGKVPRKRSKRSTK
jgi:hypothetical protein